MREYRQRPDAADRDRAPRRPLSSPQKLPLLAERKRDDPAALWSKDRDARSAKATSRARQRRYGRAVQRSLSSRYSPMALPSRRRCARSRHRRHCGPGTAEITLQRHSPASCQRFISAPPGSILQLAVENRDCSAPLDQSGSVLSSAVLSMRHRRYVEAADAQPIVAEIRRRGATGSAHRRRRRRAAGCARASSSHLAATAPLGRRSRRAGAGSKVAVMPKRLSLPLKGERPSTRSVAARRRHGG